MTGESKTIKGRDIPGMPVRFYDDLFCFSDGDFRMYGWSLFYLACVKQGDFRQAWKACNNFAKENNSASKTT